MSIHVFLELLDPSELCPGCADCCLEADLRFFLNSKPKMRKHRFEHSDAETVFVDAASGLPRKGQMPAEALDDLR